MKILALAAATSLALAGSAFAAEPMQTPPDGAVNPPVTTPQTGDPATPADATAGAPMSADTSMTTSDPAAPIVAPTGVAVDTATGATTTFETVTMAPVADTPENRAKYGQPMSRAGRRTAAAGN